MGFMKNSGKCLYFVEKHSMIFQNSLIKSLIHKIKKHKNF